MSPLWRNIFRSWTLALLAGWFSYLSTSRKVNLTSVMGVGTGVCLSSVKSLSHMLAKLTLILHLCKLFVFWKYVLIALELDSNRLRSCSLSVLMLNHKYSGKWHLDNFISTAICVGSSLWGSVLTSEPSKNITKSLQILSNISYRRTDPHNNLKFCLTC